MKLSFINLRAIGLLEVLNSHIIVHLSVFRLGTTRGPRRNGDGDKYYLYQEFSGGGEILTTFLTSKMVILQGKEEQLLDSMDLKV